MLKIITHVAYVGQVGRLYPQAVYFPIRTLYHTLKIEQRERHKSAESLAAHLPATSTAAAVSIFFFVILFSFTMYPTSVEGTQVLIQFVGTFSCKIQREAKKKYFYCRSPE